VNEGKRGKDVLSQRKSKSKSKSRCQSRPKGVGRRLVFKGGRGRGRDRLADTTAPDFARAADGVSGGSLAVVWVAGKRKHQEQRPGGGGANFTLSI